MEMNSIYVGRGLTGKNFPWAYAGLGGEGEGVKSIQSWWVGGLQIYTGKGMNPKEWNAEAGDAF